MAGWSRTRPSGFEVRLPLPPMLMVDRIVDIESHGVRGRMVAERDVRIDDWFFQCHFQDDPVQPGCLGVDAVWQLLGFYCAWSGALGSGRALGCGEIEFSGQIRPRDHVVRYEITVRRCAALPPPGARSPSATRRSRWMASRSTRSRRRRPGSSTTSRTATTRSPRRGRAAGA